jgi:hypothetical protein
MQWTNKNYRYSLKKHNFCPHARRSAAYRIIVNKIKEKLVSRKKLNRRVTVINIDCATYNNCTHLLNWSRWKPEGGGDHGVGVFGSCAVCVVVVCGV